MNGTKQMFLFCFFFLTFLWQYTSFPCLQYLSMLGCSLHLILFSVENFLEFIGYVFIRRLIHFVHKIGVSLAFANRLWLGHFKMTKPTFEMCDETDLLVSSVIQSHHLFIYFFLHRGIYLLNMFPLKLMRMSS